MIDQTVAIIVNGLIKRGLMRESELELYRFGINRLLLFFINIATTVVIGILCGMIWQSVIFSSAYIPLRRYAGGYHAKTPQMCYILSTLLIFGVLQVLKYFPNNELLIVLITVLSGMIIFIKAPIESVNKPLNKVEKTVFKKHTRIILLIEIFIIILCLLTFWNIAARIAACVTMAVLCSAMMVLIPEL